MLPRHCVACEQYRCRLAHFPDTRLTRGEVASLCEWHLETWYDAIQQLRDQRAQEAE